MLNASSFFIVFIGGNDPLKIYSITSLAFEDAILAMFPVRRIFVIELRLEEASNISAAVCAALRAMSLNFLNYGIVHQEPLRHPDRPILARSFAARITIRDCAIFA